MKQFRCDVCGLLVGEYKLSTLYERLQIHESANSTIEHVCEECRDQIVEAQEKIEEALKPIKYSWLKQIVLKLKWKKFKQE